LPAPFNPTGMGHQARHPAADWLVGRASLRPPGIDFNPGAGVPRATCDVSLNAEPSTVRFAVGSADT
jgi:hypothetical protein